MKLNNLLNVLRGGNLALGQKLHNLLTEDCVILEYTDDAVLFHKNNHLVLAKFKHNLSESKMSADDVLDNEVIYVSGAGTEKDLKNSILSLVDNIVEENYVAAEEELATFCEQYFQYSLLKRRYPSLFAENLVKKSKGVSVRRAASKKISSFRSDIFSLATINESIMDASEYVSVLENTGLVLALGKKKILPIVLDALLGNEELAETITDRLFDTALNLSEANKDLMSLVSSGYDVESGKYNDEDEDEVDSEDLDATEGDEDVVDFEGTADSETAEDLFGEGPDEFKEFDPSKLSDEEIKTLHIDILKSFLGAMSDFVGREASNPENDAVDPDLDDKLKEDLDKLDELDVTDEELSRIEADWQPVLSFFLDSDLYKSDQDLGDDEVSLDDVVDGGEDADLEGSEEDESMETPEEEAMETPEEESLEHLEGGEEPLPEEEEQVPPARKPSLKV